MLYDSSLPEEDGYPRSLFWRNLRYAVKLWRRGEAVQKQEEDYWLFQSFQPITATELCASFSANQDIIDMQLNLFQQAIDALNEMPDGYKAKWANAIYLYRGINSNLIRKHIIINMRKNTEIQNNLSIFCFAESAMSNLGEIQQGDELAFVEESGKTGIDIIRILKTLIEISSLDFFKNDKYYSKRMISAKATLHTEKAFELKNIIESINSKISEKRKEKIFEKHSIHFKQAEKKHGATARFFMWSAVISLIFAIFWISNIYCESKWFAGLTEFNSCTVSIEDINSIHPLIYLISERGAFVAILLSIVFACLRGYFASSHNKILNNHRYNCVKTFQYFNEISPDPYLTMKAVDAAFDHLPTGFTKLQSNKEGTKDSLTERVELFKVLNKIK